MKNTTKEMLINLQNRIMKVGLQAREEDLIGVMACCFRWCDTINYIIDSEES